MLATFDLDDASLGQAQHLTGMTERTPLMHEGLRALIPRESAPSASRGWEPPNRHSGFRYAGAPEARRAIDRGRYIGVCRESSLGKRGAG